MFLKDLLFEDYEKRIVKDREIEINNFFIRFGKFGSENSKVGLDSEFIQDVMWGKTTESGLSVYFVNISGENYNIQPPNRKRARYMLDGSYFNDMLVGFLPAIANGEVYILKGDLIKLFSIEYDDAFGEEIEYHSYETGSDGEPLIDPESIQIVKTLTVDEILDNVFYHKIKIGDIKAGMKSEPIREIIGDHYYEDEQ